MVKRTNRLEKGIESLKEEIETHFDKLDRDIIEDDGMLADYHIKEIDKSLITALERKISLLGQDKAGVELIKKFRNRLEEYKKKLNMG
ncbi:MAG: hypothetical protein AABY05_02905 [Nanoarchaeota archaeon]